MNAIYRSAIMLACLGLTGVGATARASSSGNWILNGSTVSYAGANELRIGSGTVYSGGATGSTYQITAATVTTSTTPSGMIWASSSSTGCPTSTTSLQGASAAYYVYYEGSTSIIVATSVPPFEDGYPQGSLYTKSGSTCTGNSSGLYNYIGSFITDSSSNIVPFERYGQQVLLNFNGSTNSGAVPIVDAGVFARVSETISGKLSGVTFPVTASALILEAYAYNSDLTYNHTIYIVDPNNGGTPTNANCATGTLPTGIDWTGGLQVEREVEDRIIYPTATDGGNTLTASVCDASWGTTGQVLLSLGYYGYVEQVPYLDQIR